MLLKVGATYPEMAGQEKVIDDVIELLKKDQLDENISTEALEKCVNYFNTLFPVLFGPDVKLNHMLLLTDNVRCLTAVADSFVVDATVVRCLMEVSQMYCYLTRSKNPKLNVFSVLLLFYFLAECHGRYGTTDSVHYNHY